MRRPLRTANVLTAYSGPDMSAPSRQPGCIDPPQFLSLVSQNLDGFREETAVDSIHNRLSADLPTTEESPVEALDGVLTSLYTIKLEVDVTLSVRIKGNVDNMTVFLLTFSFDIVFKLLDPSVAFFPFDLLAAFSNKPKVILTQSD